jgi:GGDEF domain-containing protein
VLCPETDTEGALTIARRICNAVQNSSFDSGRKHTISIGVAVLMGADSIDSLLLRAYTALNRAKSEERNCVCAL